MAAPRGMTKNMLTPLRSVRNGNHLVVNSQCDAAEEVLFLYGAVPTGRCLHLTDATGPGELPTAKLGCEGNQKVPVYIFRDSDAYSVGFEGPDPTVEVGPSYNVGEDEKKILMYVGLEGFELATTEYDNSRTYKVGEYLKSPELTSAWTAAVYAPATSQDDARTHAGKLTNEDVLHGADTIVGIVSPGVKDDNGIGDRDTYGNLLVSFYTTYRPPMTHNTGAPTTVANRVA